MPPGSRPSAGRPSTARTGGGADVGPPREARVNPSTGRATCARSLGSKVRGDGSQLQELPNAEKEESRTPTQANPEPVTGPSSNVAATLAVASGPLEMLLVAPEMLQFCRVETPSPSRFGSAESRHDTAADRDGQGRASADLGRGDGDLRNLTSVNSQYSALPGGNSPVVHPIGERDD
jgi:hypothetical protein